ncbi:GA-like domain-containing protein [Aerococcus christensenii]|uniref:GA-like domain-containing protein n=1 Tax=Aerococcus christensenii TaxID=87541 RepID=UPI003F43A82F
MKQAQLDYQTFLEAVEQSQSDHKITKEEHQYLKELWQAVLTAKQKANQAVTLLADGLEKEMLVAKLQALKILQSLKIRTAYLLPKKSLQLLQIGPGEHEEVFLQLIYTKKRGKSVRRLCL